MLAAGRVGQKAGQHAFVEAQLMHMAALAHDPRMAQEFQGEVILFLPEFQLPEKGVVDLSRLTP
jgi:hypothetical protein